MNIKMGPRHLCFLKILSERAAGGTSTVLLHARGVKAGVASAEIAPSWVTAVLRDLDLWGYISQIGKKGPGRHTTWDITSKGREALSSQKITPQA